MAPRNIDRLTRVYGPTTWDVYARLDESLDPAGPDQLHELAGELLPKGGTVLDAGCRDAEHLIRLVRDHEVTGVGVEPVPLHVERARAAVTAAGLDDRITLHEGVMHDLPEGDATVDLVWCRDVLTQVDDLDGALVELARVLRPDGRILLCTTFATDRLDGQDAEMLDRHLGNVAENLDRARVEAARAAAGLIVERTIRIGTEWREHAEERTRPMSQALLRLSRLRRQREAVVVEHGQDIYDHVEANLHWEVFQALGKLEPIIDVLVKGRGPTSHDAFGV